MPPIFSDKKKLTIIQYGDQPTTRMEWSLLRRVYEALFKKKSG